MCIKKINKKTIAMKILSFYPSIKTQISNEALKYMYKRCFIRFNDEMFDF